MQQEKTNGSNVAQNSRTRTHKVRICLKMLIQSPHTACVGNTTLCDFPVNETGGQEGEIQLSLNFTRFPGLNGSYSIERQC